MDIRHSTYGVIDVPPLGHCDLHAGQLCVQSRVLCSLHRRLLLQLLNQTLRVLHILLVGLIETHNTFTHSLLISAYPLLYMDHGHIHVC